MSAGLIFLAGIYAPHFLRRAGFEAHAETMKNLWHLDARWLSGDCTRQIREDVAKRYNDVVLKKGIPPLADGDPEKALIDGCNEAFEIWTIAERCCEILFAESDMTLEELREEQRSLFATSVP